MFPLVFAGVCTIAQNSRKNRQGSGGACPPILRIYIQYLFLLLLLYYCARHASYVDLTGFALAQIQCTRFLDCARHAAYVDLTRFALAQYFGESRGNCARSVVITRVTPILSRLSGGGGYAPRLLLAPARRFHDGFNRVEVPARGLFGCLNL